MAPLARHGIFFPDAMHIDSPASLMASMAAALDIRGVRHLKARAVGLKAEGAGIKLELQHDGQPQFLQARQVVVAAGAHSLDLARQAGDTVPLDTERGYHVEYDIDSPPVRRPVCPVERGIYATPMQGRLRIAGTVEFGGVVRPANPRRWALLDRGARELFPSLPSPASQWLGFRPSMPDSVPVIGRASAIPRVMLAFGHGHLGLTLAAVTADLITAELLGHTSTSSATSIAAYSPQR